MTENSTN